MTEKIYYHPITKTEYKGRLKRAFTVTDPSTSSDYYEDKRIPSERTKSKKLKSRGELKSLQGFFALQYFNSFFPTRNWQASFCLPFMVVKKRSPPSSFLPWHQHCNHWQWCTWTPPAASSSQSSDVQIQSHSGNRGESKIVKDFCGKL